MRGDGGQIAVAPTLHASGRRYRWRDWGVEPAPLPEWLAERLRPPPPPVRESAPVRVTGRMDRYARAALEGEMQKVASAVEGYRNEAVFLAACNLGELVGAGVLSAADAGQHLLSAAVAKGLSEAEARPTILSGLNRGVTNPRVLAS